MTDLVNNREDAAPDENGGLHDPNAGPTGQAAGPPVNDNGSADQKSGVLSQGLVSGVAHAVTSAVTFVAVIGMIHLMDKGSWGLFSLAIQITVFSSMIADFGIGPVIMRRLAIEPGRSAGILADATLARMMLLAPTWIVTIGIGLWLEPNWNFFLVLNLMLINAVISSKVPVLRGTLDVLYRSQSRMGFPTMTMAVDSVVLLLFVLLLPELFRDPLTAMMLYTGSNVIGAVIMVTGSWRFIRRINIEPLRVSWTSIRGLLEDSSPLAVFLLLNALHISIDSIYLKLFHGDISVGVWNTAVRILTPLAVFPTIVAISAAPYFARASVSTNSSDDGDTVRLFSLGMKTLLIGAVVLSGFGALNAHILFDFEFLKKYSDAIVPMIILFITFLPMSMNIFLVEVNNARGKLVRNRKFSVILAVVSVLAGSVLIWQYSVEGAAISKLLAILVGLTYLLIVTREGIPLRLKPIAWKAAVILFTLLLLRMGLDFLHPLLSNGITLLAVTAEVFLLRFFSSDELVEWKLQLTSVLGRIKS